MPASCPFSRPPTQAELLDLTLPTVELLSNDAIAALIVPLFRFNSSRSPGRPWIPDSNTIIHVCNRIQTASPSPTDPIVFALLRALSPPIEPIAEKLIDWVLIEAPKDVLELFRSVLENIVSSQLDAAGSAGSAIRVLNNETWIPRSKFDDWAIHSLKFNVNSSEQMVPHVDGLLSWLADSNWPNFRSCKGQLLRYPEISVEPVRAILRGSNDGEWNNNLVLYLMCEWDDALLERAREEIKRIAEHPTKEEKEWELDETCRETLEEMDKDKDKITSKAEG